MQADTCYLNIQIKMTVTTQTNVSKEPVRRSTTTNSSKRAATILDIGVWSEIKVAISYDFRGTVGTKYD